MSKKCPISGDVVLSQTCVDCEDKGICRVAGVWCGAECANYNCEWHPVHAPRLSYSTSEAIGENCEKRVRLLRHEGISSEQYILENSDDLSALHVYNILGSVPKLRDYETQLIGKGPVISIDVDHTRQLITFYGKYA